MFGRKKKQAALEEFINELKFWKPGDHIRYLCKSPAIGGLHLEWLDYYLISFDEKELVLSTFADKESQDFSWCTHPIDYYHAKLTYNKTIRDNDSRLELTARIKEKKYYIDACKTFQKHLTGVINN